MNTIGKLINTLCPDGISTYKMSELFDFKNGYTPSKANPDYWDGGSIPWFRMEDIREHGRILSDSLQHVTPDAIKGSLFPKNTIILSTSATIGEHALVTVDYLSNQRFTCLIPKNIVAINPYYLNYYADIIDEWCTHHIVESSFPAVDMNALKNLIIPMPPKEIQDEIVRILDSFIATTDELNAELNARKKHYEFYRDKLLSFDDRTPEESKNLGIRWIALGDISEIYDGVHQTPDYTSQGVKFVSVEDIDNLYSSNKYISAEDYERDYKHPAHKGDLFMTRIGSIGKCTVLTQDEMLAYYVTLALIRPKTDIVSSDYLKHIIESNIGKRELYKRTLIHATPIKINLGDIGKIMLPIPSIEHQNKLTAILNNFEKLTIDLNEGLPAEIEARQKQYEYYRDKLLSFS